MTLAAIPTKYRGVQMRSRLEARWACMFDQLGWRWDYEPIDFNGWIPDFAIQAKNEPLLVECKPIFSFCEATGSKIVKALGSKFLVEYEVLLVGARLFLDDTTELGPHIGWISEEFYHHITCEPIYWDEAIFCEPNDDPKKYGVMAAQGRYTDRITDYYDGNVDAATYEVVESMWREAGNRVQWKAPR